MVRVMFGHELKETVGSIDLFFKHVYEDGWFDDPVVQQMVRDIDKSEVCNGVIKSPVLGRAVPYTYLSGGVKAMICMYKMDGPVFNLTGCGENCQEWLARLFKMKDITVCMTGLHILFKDFEIEGVCLNDNSEIKDWHDWFAKMFDFSENYYDEEYVPYTIDEVKIKRESLSDLMRDIGSDNLNRIFNRQLSRMTAKAGLLDRLVRLIRSSESIDEVKGFLFDIEYDERFGGF